MKEDVKCVKLQRLQYCRASKILIDRDSSGNGVGLSGEYVTIKGIKQNVCPLLSYGKGRELPDSFLVYLMTLFKLQRLYGVG